MKCLAENEFGMPCNENGLICPTCHEHWCIEHCSGHPCFAVHEGDTITALVDKFYEAE